MQQDDFIYTPSSTDITVRWRKLYSYIPASEQPYYQAKWKEFRDKLSRTLEDVNPEKPSLTGKAQSLCLMARSFGSMPGLSKVRMESSSQERSAILNRAHLLSISLPLISHSLLLDKLHLASHLMMTSHFKAGYGSCR